MARVIMAKGRIVVNKSFGDYNNRNTKIKIVIPRDNYTLTLIRNTKFVTDLGLISWGDGTSGDLNELYIHTYNKAGVYEIQGHFIFGLGYEPTKSMKEVLVEVIQLSDKSVDLAKAFFNCTNLTNLNLSNVNINLLKSADNMIYGCTKLKINASIQKFFVDLHNKETN